jgi:hypothetical protein
MNRKASRSCQNFRRLPSNLAGAQFRQLIEQSLHARRVPASTETGKPAVISLFAGKSNQP